MHGFDTGLGDRGGTRRKSYLLDPNNATIAKSQGIGTIRNDDTRVVAIAPDWLNINLRWL
ncbi:MAG TPA: hypothetical protein DDZ80_30565 [Cyanobacteria bacterium UBA8803]|nr:hypothetical protein [Cyanobacteria bacterium UBA9273]HBL62570.1 hypothetical protein [Cyanobacteria bacterium UBA8803]